MMCLLNNSVIPASAEVPDACKQQEDGGDIDCTLHLSPDKSHKCNDDFSK